MIIFLSCANPSRPLFHIKIPELAILKFDLQFITF